MSDDAGGAERAGGLIPYFFYNIFAHILPGGFVIVSVLLLMPNVTSRLVCSTSANKSVSQAPIAIPTVLFLIFLMATEFIGFFLGALSYFADWIWCKSFPYSLEGLRKWLGGDENKLSRIENAVRTKFAVSLEGNKSKNNIVKCSFLCWNFVATHDPNLVIVATKWDAEALLSRSVFVSSLALSVLAVCVRGPLAGAVIAIILVASWASFRYHRSKRVYGRFALFDLISSADSCAVWD